MRRLACLTRPFLLNFRVAIIQEFLRSIHTSRLPDTILERSGPYDFPVGINQNRNGREECIGRIQLPPGYTVPGTTVSTMGVSSFTSTFDLIRRFREGDETAFSQLFTKYRPRLAVLIRYKLSEPLRQRVEVDDILQEVFLDASKDIASFTYRSPGSFMHWLSSIADHVIVDEARSQARQKRYAAEVVHFRSETNPGGPEPADSKTPSRILMQKESATRLLARLDALPPDYREVILMAKVEGLSSAEMATRLGRSREAVAVLLHRALQRLRTLGATEK